VKLPKLVIALALSVALVGTLGAAAQDKAGKAKADTAQKADKADKGTKAAPKGALTAADLPKAVTDAVMAAHPKATIASATKTGTGMDTVYVVRVNTGDAGKAGMTTMRLKEDGTMATPMKGAGKGAGKKKDK